VTDNAAKNRRRVIKFVLPHELVTTQDDAYDDTVGLQFLIDTYGWGILDNLRPRVYTISKTLVIRGHGRGTYAPLT
jgi:hypothetical protein